MESKKVMMLDTIIPLLILILTIVGITKLNKKTRPDYVKNYSFLCDKEYF